MKSYLKKFDTSNVEPAILSGATSPVQSIKDDIHERLLLPKDQWIDMADDTVFDDVIKSLRESKPKS